MNNANTWNENRIVEPSSPELEALTNAARPLWWATSRDSAREPLRRVAITRERMVATDGHVLIQQPTPTGVLEASPALRDGCVFMLAREKGTVRATDDTTFPNVDMAIDSARARWSVEFDWTFVGALKGLASEKLHPEFTRPRAEGRDRETGRHRPPEPAQAPGVVAVGPNGVAVGQVSSLPDPQLFTVELDRAPERRWEACVGSNLAFIAKALAWLPVPKKPSARRFLLEGADDLAPLRLSEASGEAFALIMPMRLDNAQKRSAAEALRVAGLDRWV